MTFMPKACARRKHLDSYASQPDDTQRLAAQFGPLQRFLLPLAGSGRRMGTRNETRHRQHEGKGVFGHGNSIAAGCVHDHDAAPGGRVEIDVVHAYARASDDT